MAAIGGLVVLFVASLTLAGNSLVFSAAAYSGSISASPNPVPNSVSTTASCTYTAEVILTALGSTGYCQVDTFVFYQGSGSGGRGSYVFGPGSLAVGSHTMTVYYATGYNPTHHLYIYSSTSATLTITQGTWIRGQIVIAGTSNGIYGAAVSAGNTVYTDANGNYALPLAAGGSITVTAAAPGYCYLVGSNCANTFSTSVPVTSGQIYPLNMNLNIGPTRNPDPYDVWYNSNSYYSNYLVGSRMTLQTYSKTSGNALKAGCYNGCLDHSIPAPPSGLSNVVEMYGVDNSYTNCCGAYSYFDLVSTNPVTLLGLPFNGIPLSSPMFLKFNVFAYHTPLDPVTGAPNGHVSVDAVFSDGTYMRNVQNSAGTYILNGSAQRIHPGYERIPDGQWVQVYADLSELKGKRITMLLVGYDNGGYPIVSDDSFEAYFDAVTLSMANIPLSLVNGGFEAGSSPYGWARSGSTANAWPQVATTHLYGSQSGRVGDISLVGAASTAEDSQLSQAFRVSNDNTYLSPQLSVNFEVGTSDTSPSTSREYVEAYLSDRTTQQRIPLIPSTAANELTSWYTASVNLTPYEGHVLWLVFHVHIFQGGFATWGYFDDATVNALSSSFEDWSTGHYTAHLTLQNSAYEPNYGSPNHVIPLSYSVTSADPHGNSMSLGLDVISYLHNQGTADDLYFTVTTEATPSLTTYYVHDATVTVSLTCAQPPSTLACPSGSVTLQDAHGTGLIPNYGYGTVDQADQTLGALGTIATFAGFIPGLGTPCTIAGLIITGAQVIYDEWKASQGTTSNPSQLAFQWTNDASVTPLGVPYGALGGGQLHLGAQLSNGGGGGTYYITVTSQETIYYTPGTIPGPLDTLSTTLVLMITT